MNYDEFLGIVGDKYGFQRMDLLEKDLILQELLMGLLGTNSFAEHYAFKGGTCLIKCYLGYYRFSEDLDFTYLEQHQFENKTKSKIRKIISGLVDHLIEIVKRIAGKYDLEFEADKSNDKFVQIGGGGRIVTLKVWFNSIIMQNKTFIKLQFNFAEILCFPILVKEVKGLSLNDDNELRQLFPEIVALFVDRKSAKVYDIQEIASEKFRAILTRRGIKLRDFVDLYLVQDRFKLDFQEIMSIVEKKVKFATENFSKYKGNLRKKLTILNSLDFPDWENEMSMVLETINEDDLITFVNKISDYLRSLRIEGGDGFT